jgi:SAM-dependent methyltransferase
MSTVERARVQAVERSIMNEFAAVFDASPRTNSYVYQLERAEFVGWVAKTLREAGRATRDLAVLDAGCSTGATLALLEREGFGELTGIDLAEAMLTEAERRGPRRARWVRGALEDAPFRPGSFDVIVSCFTIHHLHDPGDFFRLVDRCLRPDGWFFALEYDGGSSVSDVSRGGSRRHLGDLARKTFARKNRRGLAARPIIEPRFNPAHRLLGYEELVGFLPEPERYELRRVRRGPLRSTLLPVLVEESALDRVVARATGVVDGWVAHRLPGLFMWIAGRRSG